MFSSLCLHLSVPYRNLPPNGARDEPPPQAADPPKVGTRRSGVSAAKPWKGSFTETGGSSLVALYYTPEASASQPPIRCPVRKAKAGGALPSRFAFGQVVKSSFHSMLRTAASPSIVGLQRLDASEHVRPDPVREPHPLLLLVVWNVGRVNPMGLDPLYPTLHCVLAHPCDDGLMPWVDCIKGDHIFQDAVSGAPPMQKPLLTLAGHE